MKKAVSYVRMLLYFRELPCTCKHGVFQRAPAVDWISNPLVAESQDPTLKSGLDQIKMPYDQTLPRHGHAGLECNSTDAV